MANTKILVVEDESIVALDIQNKLKGSGYSVPAIASSGEEAIEKAQETHPDLVLMDIKLTGGIDGIEAAEQIRDNLNIPVIYVTAYADERTLKRAKITEPFGYILKPFEQRELHSSIQMALYKHKIERKLKESEQWLATTLKSIGDAVISTDKKGFITFMNPVAQALTGWREKDALGKDLKEVFNIIDEKRHSPNDSHVTNLPRESMADSLANYSILLTKDGTQTPIENSVAPIRDDKENITGTVLIFRDITQRKRAEKELRSSREQLRSLSTHLQCVSEQERTNIAREIHDDLGQTLTALKMDLSWLDKRLPKDQEILSEKTKSMSKLIDMTIRTVQRVSTELRPGLLDDLGLAAAMEWQAEEFQNRTGIECKLTLDPENIILDQDRSTAIFRIFQETLTNVARHANATRVKVSLKEKAGKLEMKVRDDGKGITEKQISDPKSFGLMGIRERANFWGGEVTINGIRDKGTTVTVSIPVERK